jgi:hypothetical protein
VQFTDDMIFFSWKVNQFILFPNISRNFLEDITYLFEEKVNVIFCVIIVIFLKHTH